MYKKLTEISQALVENQRFLVKFAQSRQEIEATLRLRYEVFKIEHHVMTGLSKDQVDCDEFDEYCRHLVVIDRSTGRVIGTYRMQSGGMAAAGIGFYTEREYQFDRIPDAKNQILELGRACVAPEYRQGAAVAMLWAGIAECRRLCGFRYLIGCVSLVEASAAIAWGIYNWLKSRGLICHEISATPRTGFELPQPHMGAVGASESESALPPLFKGYLRAGAKVCGIPAWDREFGSVDFPMWLDFESISFRYAKHFKLNRKLRG